MLAIIFSEMLASILFRNDDDKCQQLEFPETLTTNVSHFSLEMRATNVSNYDFQNWWRQMLAIIIF